MNEYLYLTIYITFELLNYLLIYAVVFRAKLKDNKCWLFCLLVVYAVVLFIHMSKMNRSPENYVMLLGIILPFTCFKGRIRKWVAVYPAVPILSSTLSVFSVYIFALCTGETYEGIAYKQSYGLFAEAVPFVIMLFVLWYNTKKEKMTAEIFIKGRQYVLLYTCAIFSACVMGISELISSREDVTLQNLNLYGMAMTGICLLCLVYALWNGIVLYNEREYEHQIEELNTYIHLQKQQFDAVIRNDVQLRAYRHDMRAHLYALQAMCIENKEEQIAEYIKRNITESEIFQTVVYTGDIAVDAILQNLREEAEKQGITVDYQCHLTEERSILLYDLCTILSNLLNNAMEASMTVTRERKIMLKMCTYDDSMYIYLANTASHPAKIMDGVLITSKAEKNHGLGSRNVKQVIDRYHGSIEYKNEDGWFSVEIFL